MIIVNLQRYIISLISSLRHLVTSVLILASCFSNAQETKSPAINKEIDSLLNVLKTYSTISPRLKPTNEGENRGLGNDTTRIKTLNALCYNYWNIGSFDKALQYGLKVLTDAQSLIPLYKEEKWNVFLKKQLARAYDNCGYTYFLQSDYQEALDYYLQALKTKEQINDKRGMTYTYNNIGDVYWYQGNYEKALNYYLQSLKINEEIGNKHGIATTYGWVGYIYLNEGNYKKAFENFFKQLEISEKMGYKDVMANAFNGIGDYFEKEGNYAKALENHLKCLKTNEEIKNSRGVARSYGNIGNVCFCLKEYSNALDNYLKFLKLNEELGDNREIADAYACIGKANLKLNKFQESDYYLNKALHLSKEIGYKDITRQAYSFLSELHEKKGDYKRAFEYQKLFSDIKDSLLNEQSSKQMAEMNAKYESEKKDKEIQLLNKESQSQARLAVAERRKQQVILFSVSGFSILLMGFAMVIYRSFRQKQLLNIELEKSNKNIERKNLKIIDSITYAQLIQQSILMEESEIQQDLPDSFIYYQPKDIVSGDFYWFSKVNDTLIIAAIDCTGHGVPGAFMSMIGNTLLNQIVNEKHITKPSEILRLLNIGTYEALHQQKGGALSHDGMDMALCSIDYKNGELNYAGAQNPLYLVWENNLEVIKADMHTIGGGGSISSGVDPSKRNYTNNIIPIKKGMSIYLFSDGYMDQFGKQDRKKFGIQPFKDLLLNNQHHDMQQQKEKIIKAFEGWKGASPQIDDVLVMGLRL